MSILNAGPLHDLLGNKSQVPAEQRVESRVESVNDIFTPTPNKSLSVLMFYVLMLFLLQFLQSHLPHTIKSLRHMPVRI